MNKLKQIIDEVMEEHEQLLERLKDVEDIVYSQDEIDSMPVYTELDADLLRRLEAATGIKDPNVALRGYVEYMEGING